MCAIDHPGLSLGAFLLLLPTFLSPPFQFSWPLTLDSACFSSCWLRPRGFSSFLVLLAVTWPHGPLDRLSCYLSSRGDRWPHAFAALVPRSRCFTVSPPTDHGKSRSNIFHISSFTRRIEMDICSNYPTPLPLPPQEREMLHRLI